MQTDPPALALGIVVLDAHADDGADAGKGEGHDANQRPVASGPPAGATTARLKVTDGNLNGDVTTPFIQFSLSSSARRLQERPLLQFFERLLEFLLRVHHDRTVPSNGLLQWLPRDQEEPDSFLACLYLYLVTSVEENK